MNSGLISSLCTVKDFGVYLHQLEVFDSKIYDMSSISSLDLSTNLDMYTFKFWNTNSKPYNYVANDKASSSGFF